MCAPKTPFAKSAVRTMTVLTILFLLWMTSPSIFAQLDHGSFVGTITDTSGAGVPQAAIQATNVDTGITVTTKSDATGHYEIAALQPGRYRLEATAPGFSHAVADNITLTGRWTAASGTCGEDRHY